jgi:hypothetical protein
VRILRSIISNLAKQLEKMGIALVRWRIFVNYPQTDEIAIELNLLRLNPGLRVTLTETLKKPDALRSAGVSACLHAGYRELQIPTEHKADQQSGHDNAKYECATSKKDCLYFTHHVFLGLSRIRRKSSV